jgi:hypothetical protein
MEWKVFLPGFIRHHGFSVYAGWQQRERGMYRTSNDVRLPYGHLLNNLPDWWSQLETDHIFTASARYSFPMAYPDWHFSKLLYIRRLKTALFYDFGVIGGKDQGEDGKPDGTFKTNLSSFGIEFSGDMNVLRFYAPVDAGVRAGYLPGTGKPVFQMILSLDFNSL